MKLENNFYEKFITKISEGKVQKIIELINKSIKLILLTSISLLFALILLMLVNLIFKGELKLYEILFEIYYTLAFGVFYLIIWGVIPIIGILILTRIINKKEKAEIIKIKPNSKMLWLNFILIAIYILLLIIIAYIFEGN